MILDDFVRFLEYEMDLIFVGVVGMLDFLCKEVMGFI